MRMKRYLAADTRQALQRVRAEQGPDAVILSTRRTAGGVEVCAAVDYEYGAMPEQAAPAPTSAPVAERDDAPWAAMPAVRGDGVGGEIRSLRQLLETQVAALAWNDYSRREPRRARVLEDLTQLGLARDLALGLLDELPTDADPAQLERLPYALLARRIPVVSDDVVARGGILALVGPHGAGKTTTVAKLATRWVLEHGTRGMVLMSMDRDRFGSTEQLQALGRVLGVPTFAVEGAAAFRRTLDSLGPQRMVLLDTGGIAPRSERLATELAPLAEVPDLEVGLVLAASAQAGAIEEAVACYGAVRPTHCVLTRLDEATSLGGALSALIRARLPLAWLGNGPRVPDDLEAVRSHQLVARAVRLARHTGATADEDLLARRFGGHVHAAA